MVEEQISNKPISGDQVIQRVATSTPYNPEVQKGLSVGAWILIGAGVLLVGLFIAAAVFVFFNPNIFNSTLSGAPSASATETATTTSPATEPAPTHATTTAAAPMIPATSTPLQASSTPPATTTPHAGA